MKTIIKKKKGLRENQTLNENWVQIHYILYYTPQNGNIKILTQIIYYTIHPKWTQHMNEATRWGSPGELFSVQCNGWQSLPSTLHSGYPFPISLLSPTPTPTPTRTKYSSITIHHLQYWISSDDFNNWCPAQRALSSTTNQLICTLQTSAHVPTSVDNKTSVRLIL